MCCENDTRNLKKEGVLLPLPGMKEEKFNIKKCWNLFQDTGSSTWIARGELHVWLKGIYMGSPLTQNPKISANMCIWVPEKNLIKQRIKMSQEIWIRKEYSFSKKGKFQMSQKEEVVRITYYGIIFLYKANTVPTSYQPQQNSDVW